MQIFRYDQSCPIARAAEILGERWTLLLLRELALGPQRFSDLRARLSGVSPSVLTARINALLERGIIAREQLAPPAASTVYALTESGRALVPVLLQLLRWGVRYLGKPRPGDHFEPDWVRLILQAYARRDATPPRRFAIRVVAGGQEIPIRVAGGPEGTTVAAGEGAAEVTIRIAPGDLLSVLGGGVGASEAMAAGRLSAEGRLEVLDELPGLFDMKDGSG